MSNLSFDSFAEGIKSEQQESEVIDLSFKTAVRGKRKESMGVPNEFEGIVAILPGSTPLYKCNICKKQFKTKAHIKYHLYCGQEGRRMPYYCSLCNKGFRSKSHFEYHLRTHSGERPFACSLCAKTFNQQGKLTRHILCHSGIKPFTCSWCGRGFLERYNLQIHLRNHSGEKPYVCPICQKGFSALTYLKRHEIVHNKYQEGEREGHHKCNICLKSFNFKWNLENHLKRHFGGRQFECQFPDCDWKFASFKDLTRHFLTHTQEKPFKCEFSPCEKRFSRRDNLMRHVRCCHGTSYENMFDLQVASFMEYQRYSFKKLMIRRVVMDAMFYNEEN